MKSITDKYKTLNSFSNYLKTSGCMECSARCPDRKSIPKSFIIKGDRPTPIAIVLSHPRLTDEIEGRILKGADKSTLGRWLSYVKYPDMYITSAVKCRTVNDRDPHKKEIITCATNYLYYELAFLQPKIIVLMGKVAIKALFNCSDKTASDMINNRYEHQIRDNDMILWKGIVYTTYHPGFFKMGAGDHDIDESNCIDILKQSILENRKDGK